MTHIRDGISRISRRLANQSVGLGCTEPNVA